MGGARGATTVIAALGFVLQGTDGFQCSSCLRPSPISRNPLSLGKIEKKDPISMPSRNSRSSKPYFMAADDKLPSSIKGTGDAGAKNRFMPVSFDRDDTPPAASTAGGGGADVGGQKTVAAKMKEAAQQNEVEEEEEEEEGLVKPEDVPTSFEPHVAQLTPDGGATPCIIKVVGVGGGGGNAVNRMVQTGISGVEFWSLNTDAQALSRNYAPGKLAIGQSVTRGLGAGGVPSVGRKAAEESMDDLRLVVEGADMVFVTCGMGGGTGGSLSPSCADSLTVGVVTKPFAFEGRKRMSQANEAIELLREKVDTLIVIANDKLLQIVPDSTPVQDAFLVADDILRQGVVGISEIIIKPGLVNVDFADQAIISNDILIFLCSSSKGRILSRMLMHTVWSNSCLSCFRRGGDVSVVACRSVMSNAGTALMGLGKATGKTRAADAARAAIESPLLDFPVTDAKGIVFNIIGDKDLTLAEINEAANVIYENVDPAANIIFGALVDPEAKSGELQITVLATGFDEGNARRGRRSSTAARRERAFTRKQHGFEPSYLHCQGDGVFCHQATDNIGELVNDASGSAATSKTHGAPKADKTSTKKNATVAAAAGGVKEGAEVVTTNGGAKKATEPKANGMVGVIATTADGGQAPKENAGGGGKGKGKGKGKGVEKRAKKKARRSEEEDDDHLEAISKDELSLLSGNVIIPRARRSAAIASQRRTASEIGKFVGRPDEDDDDSDEDGEVGGNFTGPASGLADDESDEAELEF
eukprot:jgi/Undpi1/3418/HiC_scaffold_16.g06791.m1